jgi:16S rRNA (uracil1498-N3)-methyltransferase
MHRFFALPESFRDERVLLDSSETRHLRDVLRLALGANVTVFDGCGGEYSCTVVEIKKNETELLVISKQEAASPESALKITVAAAMLKGEKFDLVVQKAVELGVIELVPLQTARCDVKPRDASKRVERWRRIALEASKQTGRASLMKVREPMEFNAYLTSQESSAHVILFSEREGEKMPSNFDGNTLTAIVGPEGGWDDDELRAARSANITVVTLGGRILRAETAAIAITAVLQHRFGDLN